MMSKIENFFNYCQNRLDDFVDNGRITDKWREDFADAWRRFKSADKLVKRTNDRDAKRERDTWLLKTSSS
jgi:hypothetical protein